MALSGTHLRVALSHWDPWVGRIEYDEDGNVINERGILIDLLGVFMNKLNFTYSLHEPSDFEWGRITSNGTWTGMVGMLHRKEVDMALGPFSITYLRTLVSDFSEPMFVDSIGIFLPRPTIERDLASFLMPFSWQVWVAVLLFFLASVALGMFIDWVICSEIRSTTSFTSDYEMNRLYQFQPDWILRLLCTEPINLPSMMWVTGQIFIGTWMLTAIILSSSYQGILTSLLAAPKVSIPVDSIRDLVEYGKIPWAVEIGSAIQQRLQEAESGDFKHVHERAELIRDMSHNAHRIKAKQLSVLADVFTMKILYSQDFSETGSCHFYIAKEKIWTVNFAVSFQEKSPLVHLFDPWIVALKEGGIFNRWLESLTPNVTACMVKPGKESAPNLVLSIRDMAGIFLLFIGGVVVSMVSFITEITFHKTSMSVLA